MIYITGDTHANWVGRLKTDNFPVQKEMTKDDYVIICGDFGLWDNSETENNNLKWLESKPFTTLFVSGNHDNYDMLDVMAVEEWNGGKINKINESVYHLMRGQVFNIDGNKIFTFGGASSHDIADGILEVDDPDFKRKKKELDKDPFKLYRINHVSWWERELPSEEEMEEGILNLKKHCNKVDYIITHCPPTSVLHYMTGYSDIYKGDVLTDYLDEILNKVEYKEWFFGHMHINERMSLTKSTALYRDIIRIA